MNSRVDCHCHILPMLDDELYDMQGTDLHNEKYADFFDSFGFSVN